MAANDSGERTEDPTPKRLSEARDRGQVARSVDLTAALGLLATLLSLWLFGPRLADEMKRVLHDTLTLNGAENDLTVGQALRIVEELIMRCASAIAPIVLIGGGVAVAVGAWQTKFLFTTKALKPNPAALNPISGIKRVFGADGAVESLKALAKLGVIGLVAWLVIRTEVPKLAALTGMPVEEIMPLASGMLLRLCVWVAVVYLLIALADRKWQSYRHTKQLKMTKEEVKQEARQADMSPETRGRIKSKQMEMSRKRMMAAVAEADVVITNPTHYAVALKYDPQEAAPKVVALGVDAVALEIRRRARDAGVTVHPDPPLARQLYAACDLDELIPEDLFVAVAHVLALVYQMRDRSRQRSAPA